jgi:hypothetical protein
MENQIKLDLSQTPWIKCEGGNVLWDSSMLFKRISPLMSPSGKEELLPAEIIICKTCGKVPKFFWEKAKEIPEELRSNCVEGKTENILPSSFISE